MQKIAILTILSGCLALIHAGVKTPLPVVGAVDLHRYLGKWYEIATIPQRFQKGCVCVTAEYSLNTDGTIKVVNSCRKESPSGPFKQVIGRAKVVAGSNNAKLRVSFFRPFWGDYWIVGLDPDYQWAIVSNAQGSTCWILARTPRIAPHLYDQLVRRCQELGINTTKLVPTPQECGN